MSLALFALPVASGSFGAGLLGAVTGLGGGIVVVPMLTILFHVDSRYAIGASLVSEVATIVGALVGAALAHIVPTSALAVLFGLVLLYTAYRSLRGDSANAGGPPPDPLGERLRLNGSYPEPPGRVPYVVHRVRTGFGVMLFAGMLSALLGIGSGVVKVLAMDRAMRLPFKVSTTTSNFMIGVTAAASAGVYLHRGYIEPEIAFPVMHGVLAGSMIGARVLARARTEWLRRLFTVVVAVLALEMLYKGLTGG